MGDIYGKSVYDELVKNSELYKGLLEENKKLKEENELLNDELAWMKTHTRYNRITQEEYIDGTMSVTEAKLRMRQAKDKQNYISKLEEENKALKNELMEDMKTESKLNEEIKKLKSDLGTVIDERDNAFKKIEQLKEDIDNGFNRETDLRNKRADSLLENKDLRDKIEELETDYDRLKVAFEDVVSGK